MWAWLRGRVLAPVDIGFIADRSAVAYEGAALAGEPAVVAALARAPEVFLAVADDPGNAEMAVDREDLPGLLEVVTADGRAWELLIDCTVKGIVDTGGYTGVEDDLVELALARGPGVISTAHLEREVYWLRLTRPEPPERVLARFVGAVVDAHRELARRLDIALPG
ncbi:hypothetical protein [Couchioplanes azureus]|uniref:hypothetical protein n=1 Tax=Couchioplanes caeruleus TaxID=56438 RepID=UPI00166FE46C|nr:hypothetical protein [Couchioplanes caeruleus]GGQ59563.1 hypothetical protein GCM10010166_31280 [Couchioplanes caeruleus subsp. azureus]